jgi:hypothetical protein
MLATCLMWHDELEAAEEQMQAALTLAQQIGDLSIQLLCRAFMTVLFRKQKQVEKVKSSVSGILGTHSHIYDGMASAAQAWVAWKEGRYADVQEHAQTALLAWEPTSIIYPYQWTALWPLIGVALSQDHISDAMNYARMLLFPTQESLPDQLTQMIEVALQAWDSSQTEIARSSLQEAIVLAEEMGCF